MAKYEGIQLAREVMERLLDPEGFTIDDAHDLEIWGERGADAWALVQALENGSESIDKYEREDLAGRFGREFADELAGADGYRTTFERAKWLADNAHEKDWRWDYSLKKREDLLRQLDHLERVPASIMPDLVDIFSQMVDSIDTKVPDASSDAARRQNADRFWSIVRRLEPAQSADIPILERIIGNSFLAWSADRNRLRVVAAEKFREHCAGFNFTSSLDDSNLVGWRLASDINENGSVIDLEGELITLATLGPAVGPDMEGALRKMKERADGSFEYHLRESSRGDRHSVNYHRKQLYIKEALDMVVAEIDRTGPASGLRGDARVQYLRSLFAELREKYRLSYNM